MELMPTFLALTGKKCDESAHIKCIPVLTDMVFEATIPASENANEFINGTVCGIIRDEENAKGVGISLFSEPAFIVVNDSNRKNRIVSIRKL